MRFISSLKCFYPVIHAWSDTLTELFIHLVTEHLNLWHQGWRIHCSMAQQLLKQLCDAFRHFDTRWQSNCPWSLTWYSFLNHIHMCTYGSFLGSPYNYFMGRRLRWACLLEFLNERRRKKTRLTTFPSGTALRVPCTVIELSGDNVRASYVWHCTSGEEKGAVAIVYSWNLNGCVCTLTQLVWCQYFQLSNSNTINRLPTSIIACLQIGAVQLISTLYFELPDPCGSTFK